MDPVLRQVEHLANRFKHMENTMIDPAEFGELKGEFKALARRVDEMADDVRSLLDLANQGKGGLWMFRAGYVALGSFGVWLLGEWAKFKGLKP